MASNSDTVSDSHTNSLSNRSESQPDNDFTHNELKGWLLKRGRLSRKWKKQWFQLKNCDLYYGNTSEQSSLKKKIPLTNADLSEANVDKKQYAFRIKSKENGRTYYMQAENESEQNDWMQAICFAKAAGSHGSNSQACVIQ
ncbi:interactor protein for cytohesin exchange factors 1-like [Haliotis asinina]|uniref:interactor protein for cytohesin exchange factors 1-like n=1 Tax=Haliotis asinina TaxID=109174 RepID=UPI003531D2F6